MVALFNGTNQVSTQAAADRRCRRRSTPASGPSSPSKPPSSNTAACDSACDWLGLSSLAIPFGRSLGHRHPTPHSLCQRSCPTPMCVVGHRRDDGAFGSERRFRNVREPRRHRHVARQKGLIATPGTQGRPPVAAATPTIFGMHPTKRHLHRGRIGRAPVISSYAQRHGPSSNRF
jgi:hypothetical protein